MFGSGSLECWLRVDAPYLTRVVCRSYIRICFTCLGRNDLRDKAMARDIRAFATEYVPCCCLEEGDLTDLILFLFFFAHLYHFLNVCAFSVLIFLSFLAVEAAEPCLETLE